MAYAWQTVEQAAVTLGISTRTIARRIAKGELESRLNSGRREVYICLPATATPGVETLEGESQRIHSRVATRTRWVRAMLRHRLPHRQRH